MKIAFRFVSGICLIGMLLFTGTSRSADGESLFVSKCGKCHHADGDAPSIAPVKYASVQWKRFFERDKHKRKKDISSEITAQELALIEQYLIDHAADSDRPVAAGIK